MTLNRLDQSCAAVLPTKVWMLTSDAIQCENIERCERKVHRSRKLMVISPEGLLNDTKWACVLNEKGDKTTYYCNLRYL